MSCRLDESFYSRVTVKGVLCCTNAEAPESPDAETVILAVDVVDLVVVVEDVPPKAERAPSAVKPSARTTSSCSRVRFLKPKKQSATARAVTGTSAACRGESG